MQGEGNEKRFQATLWQGKPLARNGEAKTETQSYGNDRLREHSYGKAWVITAQRGYGNAKIETGCNGEEGRGVAKEQQWVHSYGKAQRSCAEQGQREP